MTTSADPAAPGRGRERLARWTILLYVVASIFSLLSWPAKRDPLAQSWVDVVSDITNLPVTHSLINGVLLLLLTGALARRKRFALWIVIIFQVLGVVYALGLIAHLTTGDRLKLLRIFPPDLDSQITVYLGGVFGVAAAIALFWARSAFPARRSPGSRLATVITLVGGMAISVTFAAVLAETLDGSFKHPFVPLLQGVRAALGLEGLVQPDRSIRHLPPWALSLSSTISVIVVLAAVTVFLRSGRNRPTVDSPTELAVRKLLLSGGRDDSLGYFATRRDKSVVMSPDGRAAVSYRVVASVSLASADPLGDPDAWPAAIRAWQSEARRYGWVPAALSPGREAAQSYADAGLRVIPLGDEAVIDVGKFSLSGPGMKAVRQAVNRARRAGYTVSIRRHRDIDPAEMIELEELAERWRGDAPERGFSMALSRLGDPTDGGCVMVVARRPDGAPAGLLSLVPWGRRGVSLDLMRRDRDSVNGVIETMVTSLVEAAGELGLRRVSLNFAMFRAVFAAAEELGAGPVTKLNSAVLGVFSHFFQLESLYRSNAKYRPTWVPRYLCIDSPLSLLRVAFAAGLAEGFIPHLRLVKRRTVALTPPVDPWLVASIAQAEAAAARRAPPLRRLAQQEVLRRRRVTVLQAAGMAAYPVSVPRTGSLREVISQPDGCRVSATGRLVSRRDFGGVCFAVLGEDGAQLQLLLDRSVLGADKHDLWRTATDRGDIVSATGILGLSRSGHRSLLVADWTMAAKSLVPMPALRTGLTQPEARLRNRSLDLIVNRGGADLLTMRSTAVQSLRTAFTHRGFTELETPILQTVHGGAAARPFRTHINAYDRDLSLRIAPELFLKRLVVGGMGPIFEIGRSFRNEGVDATHNPEFTSLEAYLPYADYHTMRELTTEVLQRTATAVNGSPVAMRRAPDGTGLVPVDLSGRWPTVTVHEAVSRATGGHIHPGSSVEALLTVAAEHRVTVPDEPTTSEIVLALYEHLVESTTYLPTFYTDFPIEASPLARTHRTDPRLAERWDLVAFGMEIGTAYSELTDPVDQRNRLIEQSLQAAAGDEEAMVVDEDFLSAMELGMPPTGGLGLGVDRVVMMLTGQTIRSVLAFPFVRPVESSVS